MKQVLILLSVILFASCSSYKATDGMSKEQRQMQKEAEKKAQAAEDMAMYEQAVEALQQQHFVLETDRVYFKRGHVEYVTPSTNFVMLDGTKASVQLAFNTAYSGANGLGGVTVDGTASNIKMKTDKKGNVRFSMNVIGTAISAQVEIYIPYGTASAQATVNPNFNSNRISFSGTVWPLDQSNIFKGRSLF